MLLFELSAALVELLEDFGFHEALQDELLLVLDNFYGVLTVSLQVDAFNYLTESSLAEVANDFVAVTFWRLDDLVAAQNVLAASAETNLLLLILHPASCLLAPHSVIELTDAISLLAKAAEVLADRVYLMPLVRPSLLFWVAILFCRITDVVDALLVTAAAYLLQHLLTRSSIPVQVFMSGLQPSRNLNQPVGPLVALLIKLQLLTIDHSGCF